MYSRLREYVAWVLADNSTGSCKWSTFNNVFDISELFSEIKTLKIFKAVFQMNWKIRILSIERHFYIKYTMRQISVYS